MAQRRNGIRHTSSVKRRAIALRRRGKTHREIVKKLGISLGTAYLWTKGITITRNQKNAIENRRKRHTWSKEERCVIRSRVSANQFKSKYSSEDLLGKIQKFYIKHGRIPLKMEFNAWEIYAKRFGSWNSAVEKAGFQPNPQLFLHKFIAKDGHSCDSFTEKVIDDWLHEHSVMHARNVQYGNKKYTADFGFNSNIILEFFGLAGVQPEYDSIIKKKRALSRIFGQLLIEVYPKDMYPNNTLSRILKRVGIAVTG